MPSFTWNVDPVLLQLGPVPLKYYSAIFLLVFLFGYLLLRWQILRGGGPAKDAERILIGCFFLVFIGGRVVHLLFYDLDGVLEDPWLIVEVWRGGLASHGSTAGIILAIYLVTRRSGVPLLEGMDRFTFSAASGATLVRVGNLFNSEIVGRVTDQSWGVRFPRYDHVAQPPLRHPSQLYEVILGLSVLAALLLADRWLGREKRPRGFLISLFFTAYFSGRFFVEYFKEYQVLATSFPLTMGQLLSLPGVALGVTGIIWSLRRRLPAGWKSVEGEDVDENENDEPDEEDEINAVRSSE